MNDIVLLSNTYFEGVINLPIFEIEHLKIDIDIEIYDALIFTSKNAIYSINSSDLKWKNIDSYAIAPKTAEILKKYNSKLVFTGKHSHGDEFAYELIPLLKDKKVLYVKGEKSISKLFNILQINNIEIDELITYKTVCSKKPFEAPKDNSILIFTSPSSINCFFSKFSWNPTYKAIAIGKTTAKFLPTNIKFEISEIQSIESCICLAKQLSKINL